jgi:hypothetical protein
MINNLIGTINFSQKYEFSTRISSIYNAFAIAWFCWNNQLAFALDHLLGYILCDLFVVLTNYREFKDYREIVAHHVSCFLMCYFGYNFVEIYSDEMKILLLMEMSTIFSNIRWYMDYYKITGIYYLINGFIFWASFGWFRIIPLKSLIQIIFEKEPLFMVFFIPLSILNLKWFYLITKGLLKKIFAKPNNIYNV